MIQNFIPLTEQPSHMILNSFWHLEKYFYEHVNDGKCWNVYDALKRYSLEYRRRTGCPILVMTECTTLVRKLRDDGLQ